MTNGPLDGDLPDVANHISGKVVGTAIQSGTVGGTATAPSGYANAGVHTGDVNLFTGTPVVTRYRQQVCRIAPRELVGRDDELAELAEFCTSPTDRYAWWRAAAWSGKSALMSWFVLNPPPGVRIVSFFITARLAGQNRRSAFIDNVMEQLLALTCQPPPAFLTDANREAHLLGLLDDAATACEQRGERFVLLVDGLDEDLGVHTGTDAHSIAALLPEGIRVIVASRPDPVLPADVPEHHPLRDPSIVRRLVPSPRAQVIRLEAERELRALLHGGGLGLDLLGLVTAAGGGLTSADLAELTTTSEWAVRDLLRTVAGRSFTCRRTSSEAEDTYLLAHEELQATAVDVLGSAKLERYRRLLHTWADVHRDHGWPTSTPNYLLRGYFAMLSEVGDVLRMVACATDPARQDLSLSTSGGDASLLDEIAAAQAVTTDLVALTRLAVHRDFLGHRNADIPASLPAAWLAVGRVKRATAAVRSIVDPVHRLDAMIAMAQVVDEGNLSDLLTETRTAIESIKNDAERSARLTTLVRIAGGKGHLDLAESLVGPETDEHRVSALVALSCAAARAGDDRWGRLLSRARTAAREIGDPDRRGRTQLSIATIASALSDLTHPNSDRSLAAVASSLTRASRRTDEFELAKALVGGGNSAWLSKLELEGEEFPSEVPIAKTMGQDGYLPTVLVAKAWAAVREGIPEHALKLLGEAENRVRGNTGHDWRARQVALLVAALARTGNPDRGAALIARIGVGSLTAWRTWTWRSLFLGKVDEWCGTTFDGVCFLATMARGVALAGDHDLAARTLRQAEDLVADRTHRSGHVTTWDHADGWIRALTALGAAAVEIGGWKRTLELINHCMHILMSDSLSLSQRTRAISAVARLAVDLGHGGHPSVLHQTGRIAQGGHYATRAEALRPADPADDEAAVLPAPVDEILRSESWHWAVPAVVEAVPEAFEVLLAELSTAARVLPASPVIKPGRNGNGGR